MGGIFKEGNAFSILNRVDSHWFRGGCRVGIHCFLGDMKCFSHDNSKADDTDDGSRDFGLPFVGVDAVLQAAS